MPFIIIIYSFTFLQVENIITFSKSLNDISITLINKTDTEYTQMNICNCLFLPLHIFKILTRVVGNIAYVSSQKQNIARREY